MRVVLQTRSERAVTIVQLRDQGLNTVQIAATLGLTNQTVGAHLNTAHWREERAGRALVQHLATALLK
jgi:transcriptional regulator